MMFILEELMFVGFDFFAIPFRERGGMAGGGIYIDHNRGAARSHLAGVVGHFLLENEVFFAHFAATGMHENTVAEMNGLEICAMHIGNHARGRFRSAVSEAYLFHILCLSQIVKREIDRIVEMAQNVDIVKSQLCLYFMFHCTKC